MNVGCIPTKMFVYAADVADTVRSSSKYGVDSTLDSVDWPGIVSRVFDKRIDPIARGGEAYRRGPETPNIDVYDQHARFVGSAQFPRATAIRRGLFPLIRSSLLRARAHTFCR